MSFSYSKNRIKVGYIRDKYWGLNSILVPERIEGLENFKTLEEVFFNHEENYKKFISDFWTEQGISGQILLPGEWNYAIIDDKKYHLIKSKSAGFVKYNQHKENGTTKIIQELTFYYEIIYDDWANDFLTNKVNVSGTLIKTGDVELVKNNLDLTTPIIQELNEIEIFNGIKGKEIHKPKVLNPPKKFWEDNTIIWTNPLGISAFDAILKSGYERNSPNQHDKLEIPIALNLSPLLNWKSAIVKNLVKFIGDGDLSILSAGKDKFNYPSFIDKYRGGNKENRVFAFSKEGLSHSISTHIESGVFLKEIDLSGLYDVWEINPDFTNMDDHNERTWKKFITKIAKKIEPKYDEAPETKKEELIDALYYRFTVNLANLGGYIFNEVLEIPVDKNDTLNINKYANNLGLYKNITIKHKETDWNEWLFKGKPYKGQFIYNWLIKPGDYITLNRYQKNLILNRGVTLDMGGLFMGSDKTISDKIGGKTFSVWIGELLPNKEIDLTEQGDYFLRTSFKHWFNTSYISKRQRLIAHLDRYDIYSNDEEITDKLTEGIALVPSYKDDGYVLMGYKQEDIPEDAGAYLPCGRKKALLMEEILHSTSKKVTGSYDKPEESNTVGHFYQNVIVGTGQIIRALLLQSYQKTLNSTDRRNWWMARTKRYWKEVPDSSSSYWEPDEYNYAVKYIIEPLGHWPWMLQLPSHSHVNFLEKLRNYRDLNGTYLKWYCGATGLKGGFDDNQKPINELHWSFHSLGLEPKIGVTPIASMYPNERNKKIFVWVRVYPTNEDINDTSKITRLKQFLDEMWQWFFWVKWSENLNYKFNVLADSLTSRKMPKTAKLSSPYLDEDGWREREASNNSYYTWELPFYRAFDGLWFISMVNINKEIKPIVLKNKNIYKDVGNVDYSSKEILKNAFPIQHMSYSHDNFEFNVNVYDKIGVTREGINQIKEYFTANDVFKWFLFNGMSFSPGFINLDDNGLNTFHKFEDIPRDKIGHNPLNHLQYINSASETSQVDSVKIKILKNIHLIGELEDKTFESNVLNEINPKQWPISDYFDSKPNLLQQKNKRLNEVIPKYVYKHWNPDLPGSTFHALKPNSLNDGSFKTALDRAVSDLHKGLQGDPVILDLKGTNYILFCTYTAGLQWSFELVPKDNQKSVSDEGRVKYTFRNEKIENDDNLPSVVNSVIDLNVYGEKIPLKNRYILDGKNIDIGFEIEKIPDKWQGAVDYWHLEINNNFQHIRTKLEIPKEAVTVSEMKIWEKQRLFNELKVNNAERYYESLNLDQEKRKFFVDMNNERNQQIISSITGGINQLTQSLILGKNILSGGVIAGGIGAVTSMMSGISGIIQTIGGITIGEKKYESNRKFALESFDLKTQSLGLKHVKAEEMDRNTIYNLTTANIYPNYSSPLIYKSLNNILQVNDIHMNRYTPKGKLLEHLERFYEEYGYDIFIPNHRIEGIKDIKKIIRYEIIKNNIHNNETIKKLIETRLLNGIKII